MTLKPTENGAELLNIVIREAIQEIVKQIYRQTSGKVTEMKTVYEDESMVQGTFKTNNNKEGMFSLGKSEVYTPVVIVNE